MPYTSDVIAKKDKDGMWGKFKGATKSHKTEKDGHSITSTVVHESILKYYESSEPFQGFPGWLGAKEELPDEQKILRKQNENIAKHQRPSRMNSFKDTVNNEIKSINGNSTRSRILGNHHRQNDNSPTMNENHIPYQDDKHVQVSTGPNSRLMKEQPVKHTAGMDFRAIYSNNDSRSNSNGVNHSTHRATSQPPLDYPPDQQQQSKNSFAWSNPSSNGSVPHNLQKAKTSNDLMSARLRGFGGNRN